MDAPSSNAADEAAPLAPPTERFPAEPGAPPTEQGGVAITGPRTLWPNALAALCIIESVCGILFHLFTIIMPLWDQGDSRQMAGATLPVGAAAWPWLVSALMNLALSIALLLVGIDIARRKGNAAHSARIWSLAKLGAAVLIAIFARILYRNLRPASSTHEDFEHSDLALVLYVSWTSIVPIILLLWLRRRSIRKEVATWGVKA